MPKKTVQPRFEILHQRASLVGITLRVTVWGAVRSKKNSKTIAKIGGKHKPERWIIIPSGAHKKWETAARSQLIMALPPGLSPYEGPIHVKAVCYYKGQQPDLSGSLESVGDMGQGVLWEDDKQIMSWDGSRLQKDNDNPRIELTVEPMDEWRWEA